MHPNEIPTSIEKMDRINAILSLWRKGQGYCVRGKNLCRNTISIDLTYFWYR